MNGKTPHLVQYQGSKRLLAPQILQYLPERFERLVEPFAGMAAISIATAQEGRATEYYLNDLNAPLVRLLREAIEEPEELANDYEKIWREQFQCGEDHAWHYFKMRDVFNAGDRRPDILLYLIARCVKGAVRYGRDGKFNQSPDKRRHGTSPATIRKNVCAISQLLCGKSTFSSLDYREVFEAVRPGDVVYMDPPYQGVTGVADSRYLSGVPFGEFIRALETLNRRGVDYLVSYDGECGGKEYGVELPRELGCTRLILEAGISSQGTLLGKRSITHESLYLSSRLARHADGARDQKRLEDHA